MVYHKKWKSWFIEVDKYKWKSCGGLEMCFDEELCQKNVNFKIIECIHLPWKSGAVSDRN